MTRMVLVAVCGLVLGNVSMAGNQPVLRVRADVHEVLATGEGEYVVLLITREAPARYLPLWVGEMEALAIQLQKLRQLPPRPLTLNLLESVLESGGIELTEVLIDDERDGVFLGSVGLKRAERTWSVDARPSDAIALALGKRAPIWIAMPVLEREALTARDLEGPGPDRRSHAGSRSYEETF